MNINFDPLTAFKPWINYYCTRDAAMYVMSQFILAEMKNEPQGLSGDRDHPHESQVYNQIGSRQRQDGISGSLL